MSVKVEKKENKKLRKLLIFLVAVIVVILAIIISINSIGRPYDKTNCTYTNIVVEEGDTTEVIAQKLEDNGVIGDQSRFMLLSKLMSYNNKFQPGTYFLSPSMTMMSIANTMINGIVTSSGFELPPGLTVEQTASVLAQAGFVDKDKFMEIADEVDFSIFDFIDADVSGSSKLEGYLMPGTYEMSSDASEVMVITTILNEFGNSFNQDYKARAEEMGLTVRQVLVIASIIERETSIDKERAEISAVIQNKLNLGIPFDFDYPDIPLCSPSMQSIEAALYPAESDNCYYVLSSKLDGSHVFTADAAEYEAKKAEYEQALAEKGEKN